MATGVAGTVNAMIAAYAVLGLEMADDRLNGGTVCASLSDPAPLDSVARDPESLKAGVWFRPGRLFIVSPDSQATACPLSGQNST